MGILILSRDAFDAYAAADKQYDIARHLMLTGQSLLGCACARQTQDLT